MDQRLAQISLQCPARLGAHPIAYCARSRTPTNTYLHSAGAPLRSTRYAALQRTRPACSSSRRELDRITRATFQRACPSIDTKRRRTPLSPDITIPAYPRRPSVPRTNDLSRHDRPSTLPRRLASTPLSS